MTLPRPFIGLRAGQRNTGAYIRLNYIHPVREKVIRQDIQPLWHKGASESGVSTSEVRDYRPTRISLELADVLVRGVRGPRLNLPAKAYMILCIRSSLFLVMGEWGAHFLEHAGVLVHHFCCLLTIGLV